MSLTKRTDKLARNNYIHLNMSYNLAFPGMGKTYLAQHCPDIRDCDFGVFREALGVTKDDEDTLLESYAMYIYHTPQWARHNFFNEPKLMQYIQFDRMYLPESNMIPICAEKLGVDESIIREWVSDWEHAAKEYKVPVIYLRTTLNNYFRITHRI